MGKLKRPAIPFDEPEQVFVGWNAPGIVLDKASPVRLNLSRWQDEGVVPDMPIEPGDETTRLFRERGWTHWHHLFNARQIVVLAIASKFGKSDPITAISVSDWANYFSRLCGVKSGGAGSRPEEIWLGGTFTNQALNTLFNYGCRSWLGAPSRPLRHVPIGNTSEQVKTATAREIDKTNDIFITDPPYADAINYHEITEFFIAWLRKNPPPPFDEWTWDSQRSLAIKGADEHFRRDMVAAYAAMTKHIAQTILRCVTS